MAGEKIFIVEDQRIVAEDLTRMLERLGYQVVGLASSGDEALKIIEATRPHLILMDIHIQGSLDGVHVAKQVVAKFDVSLIYLTGSADEILVARAKGTQPSGYLQKPFDEQDLKTTVELALNRKKLK